MTTEKPPAPRQGQRSVFLILLKWLFVILQVIVGFSLLSGGVIPDSCAQKGGGFADVFGLVLLGLATLQAGLPSMLVRMTPWQPSSPWLLQRDGFSATFGLCLFLVTIVLIPDLVPPRISCNESAAIADLRTLASAESAYSEANGGYFESHVSYLHGPAQCIPGLSTGHLGFIGEELTAQTRYGYARTLTAGPAPSPMPPTASQTSVTSFAYTAVPVSPGQTGVRGFCVDSTGAICYTVDTAPRVRPDGTCDLEECNVLR